jgi:hypothetical protein
MVDRNVQSGFDFFEDLLKEKTSVQSAHAAIAETVDA